MTHPPLTPSQFEAAYAQRSGLTIDELRTERTVVYCTCGEDICEGFASMNRSCLDDLSPWNRRIPDSEWT